MLRNLVKTAGNLFTYKCYSQVSSPVRYQFSSKTIMHPTLKKIYEGETITDTESILKEIGKLGNQNRQIGLKLLLKLIYSQRVPHSILTNSLFLTTAQQHPEIYIDSIIYRLKTLISRLNEILAKGNTEANSADLAHVFISIDDAFALGFSEYKKIPQNKALRSGIMLQKRYADYYLLYLVQITPSKPKKQQFLTKVSEIYRSIILSMTKLLNNESNRLRQLQDAPLGENQTQQDKEIQLNVTKESIRVLVQTNAQNVWHLKKAINEWYKLNQDIKQYNQGVLETISNIEKALTFYEILKNMSVHSLFYLHLKKVKADLIYFYDINNLKQKGTPAYKQILEIKNTWHKQYENLYKQALNHLETVGQEQKYITNVNQISLLMIGIKNALIGEKTSHKISIDLLKNQLLQETQNIKEHISNENNRKIASTKLMEGVKVILKAEEDKRKKMEAMATQKQ